MYQLGPYRLDLISDGFFEDDADTFVRQCVEQNSAPGLKVRSKSRIKVGFNGLLVRGKGRTVVIDPGTGDKPREEMVRQYKLEWPRKFLPTLSDLGVEFGEIDAVILTHLHWDHCGAATRWIDGKLVPTFPNARYHVQSRELESARRGGDGYDADDFEPLVSVGCLVLSESDGEILPDFEVRWTGGHSSGHQIVFIGESPGERAVFLSDLVPTSAQLPLDCGLSYDVLPAELRAAKEQILAEAAERNDLLLFVHAPRVRAGFLKRRDNGDYYLESVRI